MIEVPLAVAVPWLGWLETATLVGVPPVMLRATGSLLEPSATVALTAFAMGAGGVTVIETVAGEEAPPWFAAVYWNASEPV